MMGTIFTKMWRRLPAAALVWALAAGLASCATMAKPAAVAPASFTLANEPETQAALRHMLAAKPGASMPSPVAAFYAARDFRPVWTGSADARARAAQLVFVLRHTERQGLPAVDYTVPAPKPDAEPNPGRKAAAYDVALTSALFRYAHDVSLGRVKARAVYRYVQLPKRTFNIGQALAGALDDDGLTRFYADLPPPHREYQRLVMALAHYRAIAGFGGWRPITAHVSRDRLIARLDFEDPELAKIADPIAKDMTQAVMRFQERHDLNTDGRLGPETVAALNVPASYRVKQIIANMERWRWLQRHFEDNTIRVNTAAQTVAFVRNGKVVLHSKVVVGRKTMPTPLLRAQVDAVIANPPWDIPDDIAAKSIVPRLRHDADYLKTHHMALVDAPKDVDIDWQKVRGEILPYQIQQLPGPHNALGQVMLDMPNAFYVYLHGTPNQSLFTRDDREISHGCVRVEKIEKLAELVLADTTSDPKNAVQTAIATGKTQRLTLDDPLPVYMLYWTAVAEPDGTVRFFPDRYDRDKLLIAALEPTAKPARSSGS